MIGVYFLRKDKKIVYVGQSINIDKRIREHEKKKDFDDFSYIECDKKLLNSAEEAFILAFNPKYNIRIASINTFHKKKGKKTPRISKDITYTLKILKENKISQSELARKLGVPRQHVSFWKENGGIPKRYLLKTSRFLSKVANRKITTDYLLS